VPLLLSATQVPVPMLKSQYAPGHVARGADRRKCHALVEAPLAPRLAGALVVVLARDADCNLADEDAPASIGARRATARQSLDGGDALGGGSAVVPEASCAESFVVDRGLSISGSIRDLALGLVGRRRIVGSELERLLSGIAAVEDLLAAADAYRAGRSSREMWSLLSLPPHAVADRTRPVNKASETSSRTNA